MSINVAAETLTQDTESAMADILAKSPEIEDVARAFATLADAQNGLLIDTSAWSDTCTFDPDAFGRGEPLWASRDISGLERCLLDAGEQLLPVIERTFPHIASDAARLREALSERPGLAAQFLQASLHDGRESLDAIAEAIAIPTDSMSFLILEILNPCLRRAAERLAALIDEDLWYRSTCPICGGAPDFGFLKEKGDDSEFLISKAGRMNLHCSLCGSVWRFVRLVCPSCGQGDQEQMEILTVAERPRERIHVCHSCHRYLLVVDLMERNDRLHPVLTPLGLLSLDILAQGKGYEPLAVTPWNQFP